MNTSLRRLLQSSFSCFTKVTLYQLCAFPVRIRYSFSVRHIAILGEDVYFFVIHAQSLYRVKFVLRRITFFGGDLLLQTKGN